jgi:hypothetical protein
MVATPMLQPFTPAPFFLTLGHLTRAQFANPLLAHLFFAYLLMPKLLFANSPLAHFPFMLFMLAPFHSARVRAAPVWGIAPVIGTGRATRQGSQSNDADQGQNRFAHRDLLSPPDRYRRTNEEIGGRFWRNRVGIMAAR